MYHISRDGKVRPCRAKGTCPLGSRFSNRADAEEYYQEFQSEVNDYEERLETRKLYTEEEARKRGEFVKKTVAKHLENIAMGRDTRSKHRYSAERRAQHREILDELHEKYKDVPSDGKVVFSAGLPGAGKTTVLNMLKGGDDDINIENYATVSSDDFKEIFAERGMIDEIEGLTPMESSTLNHAESSYLADKFLKELSLKGKNVIYDFTCKNYDTTTLRMDILRASGYKEKDMQFVFVDIPIDTAAERALGRYIYGLNDGIKQGEKGIGGRFLPEEVLYDSKSTTGKYSSINAEVLIKLFNDNESKGLPEPIVFDNSGNIFEDPSYKPERLDFKGFADRMNN